MDAAELGGVVAMAEGAAEFGGAVLALGSALGMLDGARRAMVSHRESNPSNAGGGGGGGGVESSTTATQPLTNRSSTRRTAVRSSSYIDLTTYTYSAWIPQ